MSDSIAALPSTPERIVGAGDHRGSELSKYLLRMMRESGQEVAALGNRQRELDDDYSGFIAPWARADGWRSKRIALPLLLNHQGEIPRWSTHGAQPILAA